jgi:hypothetical protein
MSLLATRRTDKKSLILTPDPVECTCINLGEGGVSTLGCPIHGQPDKLTPQPHETNSTDKKDTKSIVNIHSKKDSYQPSPSSECKCGCPKPHDKTHCPDCQPTQTDKEEHKGGDGCYILTGDVNRHAGFITKQPVKPTKQGRKKCWYCHRNSIWKHNLCESCYGILIPKQTEDIGDNVKMSGTQFALRKQEALDVYRGKLIKEVEGKIKQHEYQEQHHKGQMQKGHSQGFTDGLKKSVNIIKEVK